MQKISHVRILQGGHYMEANGNKKKAAGALCHTKITVEVEGVLNGEVALEK